MTMTPKELFEHGSEVTNPEVVQQGLVRYREYAIEFGSIRAKAVAHMSVDGDGALEVFVEDSPIGPFKVTFEAEKNTIENAKDFAAEHNVVPRVMGMLERQFGTRPNILPLLTRGD